MERLDPVGTRSVAERSARGPERSQAGGVALRLDRAELCDSPSRAPKTVEGYRARVAEKLGLRTRADMVRFALDNGLLGG